MNSKDTPVISQNLIWRVLDDGAVIITPEQGEVRVLNEVGAFIWQLIDGNNSAADIAECLVSQFDVGEEEANNDVRAFLTTLDNKGLVSWL